MTSSLYFAITLSAVVTIALRSLPVLLLSRFAMPQIVRDWLGFVPAAIMAAIVAAELIHKPELTPSGISISLVAAVAASVTGAVSRSLFLTVIAGVAAFLMVRTFLG
ncbi:AzlD domain-containing protein [Rhizobium sp. P28RR-XV]|uniref:AzlD domain-containing protein n=1 Tax=Rhizobium sp. P28RR-XV TaxID=2726737 RepID=UPI001456F637|nr:AzlD domain-containing protein [Rhizobium sp. P28RR-XV]NLR86377.1 AzlD domain-containing protein [Rhizobium sp. P28RR-XV]